MLLCCICLANSAFNHCISYMQEQNRLLPLPMAAMQGATGRAKPSSPPIAEIQQVRPCAPAMLSQVCTALEARMRSKGPPSDSGAGLFTSQVCSTRTQCTCQAMELATEAADKGDYRAHNRESSQLLLLPPSHCPFAWHWLDVLL